MKRTITGLLISLAIIAKAAHAFEMPNECLAIKVEEGIKNDCVSCAEGFATTSSPLIPLERAIKEFTFFEEKVGVLSKVTSSYKQSIARLFRTLRDGEKEPSYKESMIEIKSIKGDFDRLTSLSRESVLTQKRIDKCLFQCSPLRKLELHDELANIQKAKIALLIKAPLLRSSVIEEKMMDLPPTMIEEGHLFSMVEFEELFKKAVYNHLQELMDKEKDISLFVYSGDKPLTHRFNGKNISKYLETLSKEHPDLVAEILDLATRDGTFKSRIDTEIFCSHAQKHADYVKANKIKNAGINAAVFILPWLLGPEVGIGSKFLMARLATWGVKSKDASAFLKASSVLMSLAVVGKDTQDLKELSDRCKSLEVHFHMNPSEKSFDEFKTCEKDFGEELFLYKLGVFTGGASNMAQFASQAIRFAKGKNLAESVTKEVRSSSDIASYVNHNGLNELYPGQVGLEFITPDQGTFSILSLDHVMRDGSDAAKKIPLEYWRYVANIYSKRLNLSQKEIENFIKSSIEMSSRTKLIMNTDKSPLSKEAMRIKGGVGIVDSRKSSDLLPLEKATGVRILRRPNEKIAELVRLTVDKDADAVKLSNSLIDQALGLLQNDKEISRVFIFTSKVHARLYKTFGVPADAIKPLDARDVLIEIPRAAIDKYMEGKSSMKMGNITEHSTSGSGTITASAI